MEKTVQPYVIKEFMENTEEKVKQRWKLLNSYGVYTEEDLKKFLDKYKLDIGVFVN